MRPRQCARELSRIRLSDVTRASSLCAALAALLVAAAAEPASGQARSGTRATVSAGRADLPRDLRQVRLVSRPQESAKRERQLPAGRRVSPFDGQRGVVGFIGPTILVSVHVAAPGEQAEQRREGPPESKVIDVASVVRSFEAQPAAQRGEAGDSASAIIGSARIESVAWLQGCWESTSPQRTVEERWTGARAGTMLGTSRTTRNGTLLEHEFITLREVDGVLAYQAQPSGQPAAEFRSRTVTDSLVVFENPGHDFPQQIGYRRDADSLHAWIEGPGRSGPRRVNFAYSRVACEP